MRNIIILVVTMLCALSAATETFPTSATTQKPRRGWSWCCWTPVVDDVQSSGQQSVSKVASATTNGSEKPGVDPSIALSHPLSQVSAEDLPVEALPAADLTPSSPSPCSHARVIVVKASSASSPTPSPSPLEVALGNLDRAIKAN